MTEDVKSGRFDIYVPDLPASNEFTAGALFLRPGGSNDYAVLTSPYNSLVADPILSPSWQREGINPDFSTGFTLNFRHVFPNSGNDINFYWAHLQTSDSATVPVVRGVPPAFQMTGPDWNIGPDSSGIYSGAGQVENHYDVFNAEVGKYVDFDPNFTSRFFTGISGVWLQQMTNHLRLKGATWLLFT